MGKHSAPPPEGICPTCRAGERDPEPHGPGITVIRPIGTMHTADCPEVPRMSPEAARELRARLKEMDDARRRAFDSCDAHRIIGGSR